MISAAGHGVRTLEMVRPAMAAGELGASHFGLPFEG